MLNHRLSESSVLSVCDDSKMKSIYRTHTRADIDAGSPQDGSVAIKTSAAVWSQSSPELSGSWTSTTVILKLRMTVLLRQTGRNYSYLSSCASVAQRLMAKEEVLRLQQVQQVCGRSLCFADLFSSHQCLVTGFHVVSRQTRLPSASLAFPDSQLALH